MYFIILIDFIVIITLLTIILYVMNLLDNYFLSIDKNKIIIIKSEKKKKYPIFEALIEDNIKKNKKLLGEYKYNIYKKYLIYKINSKQTIKRVLGWKYNEDIIYDYKCLKDFEDYNSAKKYLKKNFKNYNDFRNVYTDFIYIPQQN